MPTSFGCLAVSQTLTVAHRLSAVRRARGRERRRREGEDGGETCGEKSAHTGKTVAAAKEL